MILSAILAAWAFLSLLGGECDRRRRRLYATIAAENARAAAAESGATRL